MNTLVVTLIVVVVCIAKASGGSTTQCENPKRLDLSSKPGEDTSMSGNIFTASGIDLSAKAIYKPKVKSESFTVTDLRVLATNAKIVKVGGILAATGDRIKAKTNNTAGAVTLADLLELGTDLTFKKLFIKARPVKGATASFDVRRLKGC